jgi:hypothetical protein
MIPFLETIARRAFARAACAALCALALAPVPAQAGLIVQDLDFAFGPLTGLPGEGDHTTDDARARLFQQFDPALGTLTAARWELQSAWVAFGAATLTSQHTDPDAPVTAIFGIQIGMDTRVNAAGGLLGTAGQYFSYGRQASTGCTTTLVHGPCQLPLEFGAVFDAVLQADDLAALTGNGVFEQGVEAAIAVHNTIDRGPADITSAAQLIWADRDDRGGSGRLRLVYEFDETSGPQPVPEPGTLALAALGLGLLRRPRKRSAGAP